jgi:hypothetical protein
MAYSKEIWRRLDVQISDDDYSNLVEIAKKDSRSLASALRFIVHNALQRKAKVTVKSR